MRARMQSYMKRVFWSLGRRTYATYDDFVTAVSAHQQEIAPGKNDWAPEQIVAERGPITIVYEAMWKNEDDTLEIIVGDAHGPVTMGTLLFELNNQSREFFADADHRFFEGLSSSDGKTFRLRTGS